MTKFQSDEYQLEDRRLAQILVKHFSLDELETFCFNVGIDFDEMYGAGKSGKAREIVKFCRRQHLTNELKDEIIQQRPHISNEFE